MGELRGGLERYCYVCVVILLGHLVLSKDECEKQIKGNQCTTLSNRTCFSLNLTFNSTSSILVSGFGDTFKELSSWENLKSVPRCWDVLRPVLCAVYFPRCDFDNQQNISQIQLPGKELCDRMKGPCTIIDELKLWPLYLKCNYSHFPKGCHDGKADIKPDGLCTSPLKNSNNPESWYPGFEGCTFSCINPWFTDEDHRQVHLSILVLGIVCIACNLFVLLTFSCNWKRLNDFPDVIILYINVCYILASLGWLVQFIPGARDNIVCRSDGSPKKAEPQFKSDESILCVAVFIFIYFFTLSSIAWLVVLSYTWQIAFETSRNQVKKKKAYFHLAVWVLSFVLTILSLAFTEVDGNTLTGICFIGLENFYSRGIFVLSPMFLAWIAVLIFLIRGLLVLTNMRSQSSDLLSEQRHSKLRSSIIRIGIFVCMMVLLGVVVIGLHAHAFLHSNDWNGSMRNYIICRSNITGKHRRIHECSIENKPDTVATQLSVFCFFGFGVLMSTWLWKMAAFKSWKQCCIRKLCSRKLHSVDCQKVTSHLEREKQLTIAASETEDLIGMDFDLNSMTSFDVSSLSSTMTHNRRFSDSDVSNIGKIHHWSTKKLPSELKESFGNTNRGSSLSSSEWSASDSQKSHFSVDTSVYPQSQISEATNIECDLNFGLTRKSFRVTRHNFSNLPACGIDGNSIKQTVFQKSDMLMEPEVLSCKVKCKLFFDLQSFRNMTNVLYDKTEESAACIDDHEYLDTNYRFCASLTDDDECETLDSSNSNFTIASSDSAVLSIRLSNSYSLADSSMDSLNSEPLNVCKSDISSNILLSPDLSNTILSPHLNWLNSIAYQEFNMHSISLPFVTSPLCMRQQFWLPSGCQNIYKDDFDRNVLISTKGWKFNAIENNFWNHYHRNVLNEVEVFSLEDNASSENIPEFQIQHGINDGDESDNVSDPMNAYMGDTERISLRRKKRFWSFNKEYNIS